MDCWIVALRGAEDALVEARAVLGSPSGWVDSLEAFLFETLRPSDAAERLARLMATVQQGLAGGVALESDNPTDARLRAAALACAADDGELLVDYPARLRLEQELVLVRPKVREGWSLPCSAAALAPRASERSACRALVETLPTRPTFVARQREINALIAAVQRGSPVIVRAVPGAGGARLIEEAATRANVPAFYLPGDILTAGVNAVERALERCPLEAWVIADPLTRAQADAFSPAVDRIASRRPVIVRISEDFTLALRAPPEGVTVGPLREYDARALAQSMLEGPHDARIDRMLARKGQFLPGRIVEAVRAAVQLGTVVRDGDGWSLRARRSLKPSQRPSDVVEARIHDLPQTYREALNALCALSDGRSTPTAHALLRGLFTGTPNDALDRLTQIALVHHADGRVRIDESVRRACGAPAARAVKLLECGACAHAAQAERFLSIDRPRDAALCFAQAARSALDARAHASALRYLVLAARDSDQPEIAETIRAVLGALGPAVRFETVGARTRPARVRTFDPTALEAAAAQLEDRDTDGASRLRALAELVRGNSARAMQLTAATASSDESSSKLQLTAALAQAANGDAQRAVRSTVLALAIARGRSDAPGEAAALSLLSSLFRALGRDEDARSFAESARRLVPASG